MHYDRWRGQWVGQAVSSSDTTTTIPSDAQAGASDITSANYQQALNSISSSPAMQTPSTTPSATTLLVGGVIAIGLLYFLVKK